MFSVCYVISLFGGTQWDDSLAFQGTPLSLLLCVSVPLKLDMGHWTACHHTTTTQRWWTCLRQGPERETSVRRQEEEESVLSLAGDPDLNRYTKYSN